jgi:DNA-binding response OmpR family regulator
MNAQESRPLILIAEDEMMIAMMWEDLVKSEGFRVVMAARLPKGLELASTQPIDAAILDINLAGQESFPIADVLEHRHIPFMFSSGYGKSALPDVYQHALVLSKPFTLDEAAAALSELLK